MYKTILFFLVINFYSQICASQVVSTKDSVSIGNISNSDSVFLKVEKIAEFPDGEPAWRKYVGLNLDGTVPMMKGAKLGTYKVVVKFIVNKDGSLRDFVPETNYGHGMEAEFIRILKNGPKWNPATQNGVKVNSYVRESVTFVLNKN